MYASSFAIFVDYVMILSNASHFSSEDVGEGRVEDIFRGARHPTAGIMFCWFDPLRAPIAEQIRQFDLFIIPLVQVGSQTGVHRSESSLERFQSAKHKFEQLGSIEKITEESSRVTSPAGSR